MVWFGLLGFMAYQPGSEGILPGNKLSLAKQGVAYCLVPEAPQNRDVGGI